MSKVSEALLDKYRDINTDHDWWEFTYEAFKERMEAVGITVDNIAFSGFWSQGDGACFNGGIDNMSLYLSKFHNDDEFPMLRAVIKHGGEVWAKWKSEGRGCHEHTLMFDVDADVFYILINPNGNELRKAVLDVWDKIREYELDELQNAVRDNVQHICRKLYRQLEQEYEYLTSDEAVAEALVANDLLEEEDA